MLISHKYKFIFIRTQKTASASTEHDLARIMADSDFFIPKDLRHSRHLGHNKRVGVLDKNRFRVLKIENMFLPSDRWHGHVAARYVKKHIGAEIFDSYFKFCVEREPVSKCISKYWYLRRNRNYVEWLLRWNMSWERFLEKRELWPIDTGLWTDDAGRPMIDRILCYENLNEEIRQVGRELGFHIEGIEASKNRVIRKHRIEVSAQQREMIYQAFAESNHHTGYRIEDCKLT